MSFRRAAFVAQPPTSNTALASIGPAAAASISHDLQKPRKCGTNMFNRLEILKIFSVVATCPTFREAARYFASGRYARCT
jgi:hypothetical protein